jgi:protein transport protein SEC13
MEKYRLLHGAVRSHLPPFNLVIMHQEDGSWNVVAEWMAHQVGCNAVTWAPSSTPGALIAAAPAQPAFVSRLATAGCDHLIKIWKFVF